MANERHTDARGWEIDFSTRQSVHPYTRYYPFRVATSTTASNILSIDRGEVATNWVTNPRVEATDITMFTASGSAISRSKISSSNLLNAVNNAASPPTFPAPIIVIMNKFQNIQ